MMVPWIPSFTNLIYSTLGKRPTSKADDKRLDEPRIEQAQKLSQSLVLGLS